MKVKHLRLHSTAYGRSVNYRLYFFFLGGGLGISKKFIQKRKENEGATQVQKVNIMGAIKKKQRNKKNK